MSKFWLSKETKDILYNTLSQLYKIPKLKDVEPYLIELVRYDVQRCKARLCVDYQSKDWNKDYISSCIEKVNRTQITDRLVNSHIGIILKDIRVYRAKEAEKYKKVKRYGDPEALLKWYSLNNDNYSWSLINGTKRVLPMSLEDRLRRDFLKCLINKKITSEEAVEEVVSDYTKIIKFALNKFINNYIKNE